VSDARPLELQLQVESDGGRQRLVSPAVGLLTRAQARGELLAPGQECGVLLVLGRAHALVAPAGASGRIANTPPERLHTPLEYGALVYELEPLAADGARASGPAAPAESASGLVLRAPQTGRFYQRASPQDPPFVAAGELLHEGSPVGMIEVMKTFTHVTHRAGGGLPASARVLRYLAADGADVKQGEPLLELERA